MRENLVDKENELTVMVVESLEESRLTILMEVYSLDVKQREWNARLEESYQDIVLLWIKKATKTAIFLELPKDEREERRERLQFE